MNDKRADISRLDDAINSLNDDAEGMHSLIERSTDELERATAEGKRAADLASKALESLAPLSEDLQSAVEDAKQLMVDTNAVVESLSDDLAKAQTEGKSEFEAFASASLKATEKARDDLQTDLLSHKTAISARMDSLEASTERRMGDLETAVAKLAESTKSAEESFSEKASLLEKKISLPLYGVIAVAILQLITLAALLLG